MHQVITRSLPVILALAAGFISARGADQEKAPDAAGAQGACAAAGLVRVMAGSRPAPLDAIQPFLTQAWVNPKAFCRISKSAW